MIECGTGYMALFALGQMIIPVGFGLWWVTWIGIPVWFDSIHTKIFKWRLKKQMERRMAK